MNKCPSLEPRIMTLQANTSLRPRQKEFCLQYAITGNAARSARLAGYARAGSKCVGLRLLKLEDVQAHIDELRLEIDRLIRQPSLERRARHEAQAQATAVASLDRLFSVKRGVLRLRTLDEIKHDPEAVELLAGIETDELGTVTAYKLKRKALGPALSRTLELSGR